MPEVQQVTAENPCSCAEQLYKTRYDLFDCSTNCETSMKYVKNKYPKISHAFQAKLHKGVTHLQMLNNNEQIW